MLSSTYLQLMAPWSSIISWPIKMSVYGIQAFHAPSTTYVVTFGKSR